MIQERIAGAAVCTPLTDKLAINHDPLVKPLVQLRRRGIDLLTLFGTTGEGAGFSRAGQATAIERCRDSGITAAEPATGVFGLSSADAGDDC